MRPIAEATTGLSTIQAEQLLARDGPNELPRQSKRRIWRVALDTLREPMLALLLIACVAYLLLGDISEALILSLFAAFSVIVTIVQEVRTENVLESLRDLSAPRALVLRDGAPVRIAGRDVVTGDVLVLDQGDRIAADALLLEARDFECDESLLTGESVPVRKRAAVDADPGDGDPGGDDKPQIFAGAIVTRGNALARVTATGPHSQIGMIGRSLTILESEVPHLQRETGRIVRIAAIGAVGMSALVCILYGLVRGGWLDALLAGIAIGMSLLPEEFPVVLTVFLAMGAWRIARVGVLTRRASAIETMGATTVLCTDKTGTLTQNRMVAAELWSPDGDTGSVADGQADARFHSLLRHGALASAPVPADPMEMAFLEAAVSAAGHDTGGWTLLHTCGLTPALLAMSNIWQTPDDETSLLAAAKGAPEAIAELCRLDAPARLRMEEAATVMAARGMRVLGVAVARPALESATDDHRAHDFALLGLIGLSDPLRPGVSEAIAQCHAAGIRVTMITGDYLATAKAIAAQAGIAEGDVLTGADLAALDDQQLAQRVKTVTVFARVMPEQKLRIVSALKAAGEVVAMTGDGVNDAPALKAAHIGVAMGRRGTDVAREAAAIVLIEDDFGAIVLAIRLGRRIFDNIRKAIGFIFAVHVPIAGLALLPLLLGMPILLGPIQIALLEMIIDPVCALVFEAEREERRIMQRPPRPPDEPLFTIPVVARSVLQGGVALLVLGTIFVVAGRSLALPPAELRVLMFLALVATVLSLVIAHRSFSTQVSHGLLRHNVTFRYVLGLIGAGTAAIWYSEALRRWLGFAALDWVDIAVAIATGAGLLLIFEALKGIELYLSGRRRV